MKILLRAQEELLKLPLIGDSICRERGARIANDIAPDRAFEEEMKLEWAEKDRIFRKADVTTLHLPLTPQTRRLIGRGQIGVMKPDASLINTARGGLIDEAALAEALRAGRIGGAALDEFGEEPYSGELARLENCPLPSLATRAARRRMEFEARRMYCTSPGASRFPGSCRSGSISCSGGRRLELP
ncbi:MAG: hypothetical protein HYZ11_00425 [Candidatus Tectomicrobia bacterium]|uniref:D-isomer specific 2-hydroxyacid dehydrogenase NAD-binding domain-containing protein n=1 Tax=Tectimicrobiota bacterium TaxID=2528274 RepID=A0A932HW20_UNCTE|nr:hypothetical protein [Candidatus Tectomicrobia bacterium]